MRRITIGILMLAAALPAAAQTAEELVDKYIQTVGGMERISAAKTIRRVGRYDGGGGFNARLLQENVRPGRVREEFEFSGMTGITAWDGTDGWTIQPFRGKKDPEPLSEAAKKSMIEDADFDGPLVNWKAKGNKLEYLGREAVEGTDTYKVKVAVPNGDSYVYFLDADYYVPIKYSTKRLVRGVERESETYLGDYRQVSGWYLPFSLEVGARGNASRQKFTYDAIEINVPID